MTHNDVPHYDIAILGGGPAGYTGAIRGAQLGRKVCLIEKEQLGGTCLWKGCIPSKAYLNASELLYKAQHSSDFGIHIEGQVTADFNAIFNRKENIVSLLNNGIKSLLKSQGVTVIYGTGSLRNSRTLEIKTGNNSSQLITADNILLCTGSRPASLADLPADGETILSTDQFFQLKKLPESILILGAGYTGCETAFTLSELGVDVTLVEMMPLPLPGADIDISTLLARQFRKRKIRLLTDTRLLSFDRMNPGIRAHFSKGDPIIVNQILIGIGRALNTENMGFQDAGLGMGPKGQVIVNEKMQTNIPGIYAAGDIVGKMMLAHVASKQALIAVENMCGHNREMKYHAIPSCTFTHPPIASVGLTQQDCEQQKIPIRTGRFQVRTLAAYQVAGELDGLVKVIAKESTGQILGIHLMGKNVAEMLGECVLAVKNEMIDKDFAEHVRAHPTMAEAIQEAVEDSFGLSIHTPKK